MAEHNVSSELRSSSPDVGIVLEERFKRLPDGRLFSPSGFGPSFWNRYQSIFGSVRIVARLEDCTGIDRAWTSLPNMSIGSVHPFVGPLNLLLSLRSTLRSLREAIRGLDGIIIRAPGTLGLLLTPILYRSRLPFAVELVGDPYDVFDSNTAGFASSILKRTFVKNTQWLCANALAVSYVTRSTLQKRYPPRAGVPTTNYSSIQLTSACFADRPRIIDAPHTATTRHVLFCAASLEVPYKGVGVLIDALSLISPEQRPQLRVAGDGRLRKDLERRALSVGLEGTFVFLGRLDRHSVMREMRRCDLYVQPSLTEGLPRAIIEAMACGAPVVSTRVGGIPELLDASEMVAPGDAKALAALVLAVLDDPRRRERLSLRNIQAARDYDAGSLDRRRGAFYQAFRDLIVLEQDRRP